MLNVAFSNEEIKTVAFSIASNKSPGPDGIPGAVFDKLWKAMSKDILDGVHSFFNNGHILKEWNHTYITLIPKISNPVEVGDFRPIILCNMVYNIVSKFLTIRLRSILPDIVGPYQSAFLKGKLMGDASLVTHEILTHIKRRKQGRQSLATIKIYMNKLEHTIGSIGISYGKCCKV